MECRFGVHHQVGSAFRGDGCTNVIVLYLQINNNVCWRQVIATDFSAVRRPSALPSPASGIWMIYARIRAAVQQQESIIAQETRLFKTLVAVSPPYRRTRLIFWPRPTAILIRAFNPSTAHRTLACAEPGHSRGLQVEIPSVNDAASAVDTTSQRRIPCSQTSELRLRFRPRGRRYAVTRRRCA